MGSVAFPGWANCEVTWGPPNNVNECPPPEIPNCPPPPITENPCPDGPITDLPDTGIIAAVGTQTAASRTVEHTCYKDTACGESIEANEEREGENWSYASSCLVRKKKYSLCGAIDYERRQSQHELGEIQSASAGASCTQVNANAGFVGGVIVGDCPEQLPCPCLDLEYTPDGFCDDEVVAGPVLPPCDVCDDGTVGEPIDC